MHPLRIVGTVAALPIVALIVGGFRIGVGVSLPEMLWTLVATAVLMTTLQALTAGPRRRIQAMVAWPTLAAAVSLLVNGLVCWAAVALASAAGLAVSVAGYLPALCASLVIPIVAGATVTAVRGLVAQARPS